MPDIEFDKISVRLNREQQEMAKKMMERGGYESPEKMLKMAFAVFSLILDDDIADARINFAFKDGHREVMMLDEILQHSKITHLKLPPRNTD